MKKQNKITKSDILEELNKRNEIQKHKYKVSYDAFEGEKEFVVSIDEWRKAEMKKRYW
jgi:hypothetical protein